MPNDFRLQTAVLKQGLWSEVFADRGDTPQPFPAGFDCAQSRCVCEWTAGQIPCRASRPVAIPPARPNPQLFRTTTTPPQELKRKPEQKSRGTTPTSITSSENSVLSKPLVRKSQRRLASRRPARVSFALPSFPPSLSRPLGLISAELTLPISFSWSRPSIIAQGQFPAPQRRRPREKQQQQQRSHLPGAVKTQRRPIARLQIRALPLTSSSPVPQHGRRPRRGEVADATGQDLHRQRMRRLRGAARAHPPRRARLPAVVLARRARGLLLRVHPRVRVTTLSDMRRAARAGHDKRWQRLGSGYAMRPLRL